jgi:probable rRNA maturation factor
MIHVESKRQPPVLKLEPIERAAAAVLAEGSATGDLSVVLTDDAELRELNSKYLGVDATTDVLAFSASELDPDTGSKYLGDVIVSVPTAERQADAAGHSLEAELQLLVVHGVLHLLGYDHAEPAAKSRMWAVQARVLNGLGLSAIAAAE